MPVLDIVGDARIVAFGESMHRVHEFLQLRDRLFRILVRHAGFTALVLESGVPETRTTDAWIRRTGPGGPRVREVLRTGVTYGFGACQEALDLLTWMRERNATGQGAVRLYGMDLPDLSSTRRTVPRSPRGSTTSPGGCARSALRDLGARRRRRRP